MPIVLHPDVELWATGFLRTALANRAESYTDAVYIDRKVPAERRTRMVIVRDDGGPDRAVVLSDRVLSVRVWAESDQVAADLARMVKALLVASATGHTIASARGLGGPYELTDETGLPIRFLTVALTTRGVAA